MAENSCGICEQEAAAVLLQMCFRCDVSYHLNPYSNVEGIDCGDAIIGPELGVYYYCAPCLVAINDEVNHLAAQEAQAVEVQRCPGWTATPPIDRTPPAGATPAPAAAPARGAATPRPAGAAPRRRFRRIDQ